MKFDLEDKRGMVRIALAISSRYSGCVRADYKHCEENGNVFAVGFWHRHDEEDLQNVLNRECDLILGAYRRMSEYSGAVITVEWKEYRK